MTPPTVKLAEYLFTRLRQLGVESIFGVPGDYNLQLLDYVEPSGLHWIGTTNELNGGYAADAYARVKGLSALITTFGVGELSAINAIAGANAELAPLVHIVGTPGRQLQESRALVHHTLNDGDYRVFSKMHALVTVAQAAIWDPRTAPAQIDAVLEQCLVHSKPVYIEIPLDMVSIEVNAERLQTKISIPEPITSKNMEQATSAVLERIRSSRKPMILVDGETRAHGTIAEVQEFVKLSKWPAFTSSFGKGLIDETLPNSRGVYQGAIKPEQKAFVDSCDLVLCFGPHFSSTNSYGYTSLPKPDLTISVKATTVQVGSTPYRDVPAKTFLTSLLKQLKENDFSSESPKSADQPSDKLRSASDLPDTEQIKQDDLHGIMSSFLRSGDTVLAETGTAGYIARDFVLPPSVGYFAHTTWLSIGYMLPAALGAATARRELSAASGIHKDGRTILLIGDGSLQMTVQEISTMIREKLNIIIFVINNKGYLIERCIHGWSQGYNQIANWRYVDAPSFFGAHDGECATFKVTTNGELAAAMNDERVVGGSGLRMIEMILDPDDAPEPLWKMLEMYTGKARTEIMKS